MPNYRYSPDYPRRGPYPSGCARSCANEASQGCARSCANETSQGCVRSRANEASQSCANTGTPRYGQGSIGTSPQTFPSALAMAYVRWQEWGNLYEPEKGFCKGTIFRDLEDPFTGKGGRCQ